MKKLVKVYVEPHNGINKSFGFMINDSFLAQIDYDDVNHSEVDAATRVLQKIVEENWDEELFKKFHEEEVMKVWKKNEYGIQNDYEGILKDYLADNGIH